MSRHFFSARIPGSSSHAEAMFRFVAWAKSRRTPPTPKEIQDQWGMDRSTAYRYLNALRAAGIAPKETA